MPGAFVISFGRSGSTLLTRMLQKHRSICSISEFWTCLFMQSIGDRQISGSRFWHFLADPPQWYTTFIDRAQAENDVPSEFIYDVSTGRYTLRECPPLLTMTLPALTENSDALFDELAPIVRDWPVAPISAHARRLFGVLAERFERDLWVERSGLSYWYIPDLLGGFPDAKYVHLSRNGREVVLSMMNMRLFDPAVRTGWMVSLFQHNYLHRKIYFDHRNTGRKILMVLADVERAVTRQHNRSRPYSLPDHLNFGRRLNAYARFWSDTTELALEAMQAIPDQQILTLRYEDLVNSPRDRITGLIEFLCPGQDHTAWIETVAGMPRPQTSRWQTLAPELAADADEILRPMNSELGYSYSAGSSLLAPASPA